VGERGKGSPLYPWVAQRGRDTRVLSSSVLRARRDADLSLPLIANHDRVVASMATIPSRVNACEDAIGSILPQVDMLYVYLNSFRGVPAFLKHHKITTLRSQYLGGDLGDAGKFYGASNFEGYHFTMDDDIIYPVDYCKCMIEAIEKYQRKCVVTCHGRRITDFPITSYYHGNFETFKYTGGQYKDMFIHIPGTGVMAYHTDTFRFDIKMFRASNMADIWAAKELQAAGVPIVSIKRLTGWIKESRKTDSRHSIYSFCNRNDILQTSEVNSMRWQLHEI